MKIISHSPLSTVKIHENSRIAMEWMVGTEKVPFLRRRGHPFGCEAVEFSANEEGNKQTLNLLRLQVSSSSPSTASYIPVFVLWG